MNKRIDFSMFAKPEKASTGSVVIPEELRFIMSESMLLKDAVKHLAKSVCVFWVSNGDWSMHQMLLEVLNKTGSATVSMSTYAMSETAARVIAQLKEEQVITSLSCLLDDRVDVRSAGSLQLIKSVADRYKLVATHAKVTAIKNAAWKVAIVGSANYTENKRFEAGVLLCDDAITDQQFSWIEKAFND